jgi:hypothetical protein
MRLIARQALGSVVETNSLKRQLPILQLNIRAGILKRDHFISDLFRKFIKKTVYLCEGVS